MKVNQFPSFTARWVVVALPMLLLQPTEGTASQEGGTEQCGFCEEYGPIYDKTHYFGFPGDYQVDDCGSCELACSFHTATAEGRCTWQHDECWSETEPNVSVDKVFDLVRAEKFAELTRLSRENADLLTVNVSRSAIQLRSPCSDAIVAHIEVDLVQVPYR